MKRVMPVIRIVAFMMIFLIVINAVSDKLVNPGNQGAFRNIDGFYKLKENTLDAVYIGSSRVYAFWNPILAYSHNGITVYNLATTAQSIEVARYLVEEAHKTQPNAVMIVNLESIHEQSDAPFRRVADRMRLSANKIRLVWEEGKKNGDRIMKRIEDLFPIIRYHSSWQELEASDLTYEIGKYKSATTDTDHFVEQEDVTERYQKASGKAVEPDTETKEAIDSLLEYCSRHQIEIVFTLAPQAGVGEDVLESRTGLKDYVTSRGGTVLDYQNRVEEIGLNLSYDYSDGRHTNVHGAFIFTSYLADVLVERFGFTDKRGADGYEDWERALDDYHTLTDRYVLPFEWQPENRADLAAADMTVELCVEGGVCLKTAPAEDTEDYAVFRKEKADAPWRYLTDCKAGEFTDASGKKGCVYAVVPFKEENGVRKYGAVDYAGKEVQ